MFTDNQRYPLLPITQLDPCIACDGVTMAVLKVTEDVEHAVVLIQCNDCGRSSPQMLYKTIQEAVLDSGNIWLRYISE